MQIYDFIVKKFNLFFFWLNNYPYLEKSIYFFLIIIFSLFVYFISKFYLVKYLEKFLNKIAFKTKNSFDDIILQKFPFRRLALLPPLIIILSSTQIFSVFSFLSTIMYRLCTSLILIIIISIINSFLKSFIDFAEVSKRFKGKPIKGYIQVLIILLYITGTILLIAILINKSPFFLLSGLGALTAVLLLIFRETILSLVASFQISSYNLVKKGDWIEVPSFQTDGDVVDISLHLLKIQNFDKTISVIPVSDLLQKGFKNWKGMKDCGSRRIKRAINLDLKSVKFCSPQLLKKLKKNEYLKEYLESSEKKIKEGIIQGKLTNIGTFRVYIQEYLKKSKYIDQNMIIMVRQLQALSTGVPMEIYTFAKTTDWFDYEAIQSDIFDHLFAIIPEFELEIFQFSSNQNYPQI